MNVFIDTNILLDFYSFTSEDLGEIQKFIALAETSAVKIIVNDQLWNEFHRNREVKILEALKRFKTANLSLSVPSFCKNFDEFAQLQESLADSRKKYIDLVQKAEKVAIEWDTEADHVMQKLFPLCGVEKVPVKVLHSAWERHRRGNPPGKNKLTCGDEINWEFLLDRDMQGEDLHLISGDSDFYSLLNKDEINPFLSHEWATRQSSGLVIYRSLSQFFKANYPDINIVSQEEAAVAIEALATSGSFTRTHLAISALEKIESFTPLQVESLIQIAISNDQVGWIITDTDVQNFYKRLDGSYSKVVSKQSAAILNDLANGDLLPF